MRKNHEKNRVIRGEKLVSIIRNFRFGHDRCMEKENGEISAWGWSVNETTTTPVPIRLGPPPLAMGRVQPEHAAS
jgi:hypothetical protein